MIICNETGFNTGYGWVRSSLDSSEVYVDIQPYSTKLLLNQYGYDIQVNKRIFIDHFEPKIKIGTLLKYENKSGETETYEVKLIPYDDPYMEVICFGL